MLDEVNPSQVSSGDSRTLRTSARHGETREKIDLDGGFQNGGSEVRAVSRVSQKYEIDGTKAAPRIIMINRTESLRPQDLAASNSEGGFVETTINMKIGSRGAGQTDVELRDGFQKVADTWHKDKKSLQDLNERLSNYIDQARFLEQQNKKLLEALDQLRRNWVTETMKVKEEFTNQLKRHRLALEEAELAKVNLQVQLASADDRYNSLQAVFEDAQRQNLLDIDEIKRLKELLEEYESELNLLRKRVASFDSEKEKDLKDIDRLRTNIDALRIKLDEETRNHIVAEHAVQSNKEALEFMRTIHEAELKELEGLIYKDNTSESRNFWKNELAQALEEIQAEYDNRVDDVKNELEMLCEKTMTQVAQQQPDREGEARTSEELRAAKDSNAEARMRCRELEAQLPELQEKQRRLQARVQELRHILDNLNSEHDKDRTVLMRQLSEVQHELDQIMAELKTLLNAKLSLDLQIAAYRKLIEGEEARARREASNSSAHDMINLLMSNAGDSGINVDADASIQAASQRKQQKGRGRIGGAEVTIDGGRDVIAPGPALAISIDPIPSAGAGSAVDEALVSTQKSEMSAKTTFQRTAKGVVAIKECSADGRFIRIEYSSKKVQRREDLSNWRLSRRVDEQAPIEFVFPEGVFMEPEGQLARITIWAHGAKPDSASQFDLEMSEVSWGIGANIITVLYGAAGEEKATHTQRTALSSS